MKYKPYIKPHRDQIIRWVENNTSTYKVRRSKKRDTDIYLIDNPSIPGDSGLHIGVCPAEGWVKDYRPQHSDFNGTFIRFVSRVRNFSINDAIKEVCGSESNVRVLMAEARRRMLRKEEEEEGKEPIESDEEPRLSLPPGLLKITDKSLPKAWAIATNYLKRRQISLEEAEKYDIRYSAAMLCFPYIEYGEVVYWQARNIVNKSFLFPDATKGGVSAENFLHGFDFIEPKSPIMLVESIFNEVVIGEGTMATGGATLKKSQFKRLRVFDPSEIVLGPDNDPAGIISLLENFRLLDPEFGRKLWYVLPPKKHNDWNDMAQAERRLSKPNIVKDYIKNHKRRLTLGIVNRLTLPIIRESHSRGP